MSATPSVLWQPHRLGAAALVLALAALGACLSTAEPPPLPVLPPSDACSPLDAAADPGPDAGLDAALPLPPDAGQIRIATFNTRLFFDPICQSGTCTRDDFEQQPSEEAFQTRAEELAAGIRRLAANVVLLQEVENQTCLDALSARLSASFPVAILGEKGYAGSVDVAVLASATLLEVRRHGNMPLPKPDGSTTWFTREFLEVHLGSDEVRVIVFAAHFRSKSSDDPARRLAEAQGAMRIIQSSAAEFPKALIVLGGDLNDVPGSLPLQALEASGELLRVASALPASEQWTYAGFGGTALDHLFLETLAAGRYVPGSVQIVRDEWGGLAGSDHAALSAVFDLPGSP